MQITSWANALLHRDNLLKRSNWTQLINAPLTESKREEWSVYRNDLLLLDITYTNFESIVWPPLPTESTSEEMRAQSVIIQEDRGGVKGDGFIRLLKTKTPAEAETFILAKMGDGTYTSEQVIGKLFKIACYYVRQL